MRRACMACAMSRAARLQCTTACGISVSSCVSVALPLERGWRGVGTGTGAMSRCILTVYTSYKQYLHVTVRTRERPPVRVPWAVYENHLTSAHLEGWTRPMTRPGKGLTLVGIEAAWRLRLFRNELGRARSALAANPLGV